MELSLTIEDLITELDVKSLITFINEVPDVLGEKWLDKKVTQEINLRKISGKNIHQRKHSYLFLPKPHPLIEWAIEVEKWRKACIESHRLELNKAVLKYAILGISLYSAKNLIGFDKLIPRLKQKKQFYSAAFEIEVASSYIARDWNVEFISEGITKTPDLRITKQDGSFFYVECKCRDQLTKRDKNNETFWTDLSSTLIRKLGPKKKNFLILVKSLVDPKLSDLDHLITFIISTIETYSDKPSIYFRKKSIIDPTERYQIVINKLTDPDSEVETNGIGFNSSEGFDKVTIVSEMKSNGGKNILRNPIILGFKNTIPSDKVNGIINGFKSAVKQLPQEGPGVIWIRIPENAWINDLENSFQIAESIVQNELSGSHNTRVNAVILMTRIFQELEKESIQGLSYRPVKKIIEHENPRYKLAK